jgi:hypothetical protein
MRLPCYIVLSLHVVFATGVGGEKSTILDKQKTFSIMIADYGYSKSRHKLHKFMAAVTITINVMVMVAPVGDTFSTITTEY